MTVLSLLKNSKVAALKRLCITSKKKKTADKNFLCDNVYEVP